MAGETKAPLRVTPQAVLGLLIVAVGLLLTADNLGWLEADDILRYWPLGVVLIGVMKVLQPTGTTGRLVGAVILTVGLGLTAEHVLGWPVDIGDWWPLALVALGAVVLVRAFGAAGTERGQASAGTGRDETVSEIAIWSGKIRRTASPTFRRADLTAIMGGVELDLRAAGTAGGDAVVDVFVIWGGVEIWVPPDWAVSNQVGVLMGGAEDRSTGTQGAQHRLTVRGFVLMGGLEIKT
jgi:hypothetical protein